MNLQLDREYGRVIISPTGEAFEISPYSLIYFSSESMYKCTFLKANLHPDIINAIKANNFLVYKFDELWIDGDNSTEFRIGAEDSTYFTIYLNTDA
jgi:hypothetical protein